MIDLTQYKRIVILTGAGCSTDLGLPTFEEIYADKETMQTMHIDTLETNPAKIWKVLGARRPKVYDIYKTRRQWTSFYHWLQFNYLDSLPVQVITTNTDGIQTTVQGYRPIQYHGDIRGTVCSNSKCDYSIGEDKNTYQDEAPKCPICGSHLRPTVTLYGESIRAQEERAAKVAMRDCDLFISIGTSGRSGTLSKFMRSAQFEKATTILINKDMVTGYDFDYVFLGDAKEVVTNNFKSLIDNT